MVIILRLKFITNKLFFICILLAVLVLYKFSFSENKCNNLYSKYYPIYEKKYRELLKNYELISDNYVFIPAGVINLTFMRLNNIFLINKGLNDNVIENSYVVNQDGLVGIVKKVYNDYSVAQLVTSKNLNIAVEINDCYGTLVNRNNKAIVNDLINCKDVKVNDPVFTSKYGISSSNILTGHVSKVLDDKIYINYSFNPYTLKYVGIIYDGY